jgi:acyl-CoA-binding protein
MTESEVVIPEATPRTAHQVQRAIAILEQDPRTQELAQMIPMLVAQSGGDPDDLKWGELAEVFQAVYDAWGQAEVEVSQELFRAASTAAGGAAPTRTVV